MRGESHRGSQEPEPSKHLTAAYHAFTQLGRVRDHTLCTSESLVTLPVRKPLRRVQVFGRLRVCGNAMVLQGGASVRGVAEIELPSGEILLAELHWYEATGIGRREFKIKRFL
jgi:hypothetical protein